jgi:hypothetical protein
MNKETFDTGKPGLIYEDGKYTKDNYNDILLFEVGDYVVYLSDGQLSGHFTYDDYCKADTLVCFFGVKDNNGKIRALTDDELDYFDFDCYLNKTEFNLFWDKLLKAAKEI